MLGLSVHPHGCYEDDEPGGDTDLQDVTYPVDATGMGDADRPSDDVADQCADDPDDYREPQRDLLLTPDDEAGQQADDETGEHDPDQLKHGDLPRVRPIPLSVMVFPGTDPHKRRRS